VGQLSIFLFELLKKKSKINVFYLLEGTWFPLGGALLVRFPTWTTIKFPWLALLVRFPTGTYIKSRSGFPTGSSSI
jgi:hypothetical protein